MQARILVVDDEDTLRTVTRRMLEHLGHIVLEAKDAEQALALLGLEGTVDLIITDLLMPGRGGDWLIDRLKHSYPGIRFVVVSTFEPLPAGWPVLAKPYGLHQLAEAVRVSLQGPSAGLSSAKHYREPGGLSVRPQLD